MIIFYFNEHKNKKTKTKQKQFSPSVWTSDFGSHCHDGRRQSLVCAALVLFFFETLYVNKKISSHDSWMAYTYTIVNNALTGLHSMLKIHRWMRLPASCAARIGRRFAARSAIYVRLASMSCTPMSTAISGIRWLAMCRIVVSVIVGKFCVFLFLIATF